MASRQNSQRSSISFKKTANRKTAQCTLMAQSPKASQGGALLSSKGRLPSMKTASAAYTVSSSGSTVEVEAVASSGDSRTTHGIILTDLISLLQKVKSGMGSPDWNVSMVDIHLRNLLWVRVLPWICRSEGK